MNRENSSKLSSSARDGESLGYPLIEVNLANPEFFKKNIEKLALIQGILVKSFSCKCEIGTHIVIRGNHEYDGVRMIIIGESTREVMLAQIRSVIADYPLDLLNEKEYYYEVIID